MNKLKKILITILCITALLVSTVATVSASNTYYLGDISNDGRITATDARIILRISAMLENCKDLNLEFADTNNDGRITATDARKSLRMSALLDSLIEVPEKPAVTHSDIIPEGGTYYVGVSENKLNPDGYTSYTEKYEAGQNFPATVSDGDVYVYGDYEYRYNYVTGGGGWYSSNINGWGVLVLNENRNYYGTIIESINNSPVTSLQYTFYECTNLLKAPEIPETTTSLRCTFASCSALKTAPDISKCKNLTNMNGAFQKCVSLVTYNNNTLGDGDFSKYVIPGNVGYLQSTFYECESLTSAPAIPEKASDISTMFAYCKTLEIAPSIENCTQLKDVTGLYQDCTSLKTYHNNTDVNGDFSYYIIPDNITSIASIFEGCTSLEYAPITLPKNIESLASTFADCASLKSVPDFSDYSATLKTIEYAFSNCSSLTSTPDFSNCINLININNAFSGCSSLTSASDIPSSVIYMYDTFEDCTSLTGDIKINAENISSIGDAFKGAKNLTIYAPTNSLTYNSLTEKYSNNSALTIKSF